MSLTHADRRRFAAAKRATKAREENKLAQEWRDEAPLMDQLWYRNIHASSEPILRQLRGAPPQQPAERPTPGGANKWETLYNLSQLFNPLPSALAGAAGGQTAQGPAVGTSLAIPSAMNSTAINTPLRSLFFPQKAPVYQEREKRSAGSGAAANRFMQDLNNADEFYDILFAPGLEEINYNAAQEYDFTFRILKGEEREKISKTMTPVELIRFVFLSDTEVLTVHARTAEGERLAAICTERKGERARELFLSQKPIKKARHRLARKGFDHVYVKLKAYGIGRHDKATLRSVHARERVAAGINVSDKLVSPLGSILDVEKNGVTHSFAIFPTSASMVTKIDAPHGKKRWIKENKSLFFPSNFWLPAHPQYGETHIEGTEEHPLDTVIACVERALTPLIDERITQYTREPD